MRTTSILPLLAAALLALAACAGKQAGPPDGADTETPAPPATEADSTVYGISGEFGMSTFTLVTDGGDTLCLTRDGADGSMAGICGSLEEGQRYAATLRDSGTALATLVNLGQLERFVTDYALLNGRLVVDRGGGPDTLALVSMDEDSLVLMRKDGQELRLTRPVP